MKDSPDKLTKDLLGAKRRGPKPKPSAKAVAQRVREHRQRQAYYLFDLRDVHQRKHDKAYLTMGEAFEDLLSDLLCSDTLPDWFREEFSELLDDAS